MMVDKTGQIRIPDVGPVGVGGHNFSMVRKLIREKLSLIYQDLLSNTPKTFINIQLGTIQPITVSVVGERSEEHTSELQSRPHLVCRLLLEKKKKQKNN